jgi:hypothetical protein
MKLNPNINIPLELIDNLFKEEDIDDIIEGIRTGFARYALYATDKFCHYLIPANKDGYCLDEEHPEYVYASFLERVDYILNEVDSINSENEEDMRVVLKESAFYKETNFKDTLARTNEYINALKSLKKSGNS